MWVFTELIDDYAENLEVINMGVPAYGPDQEYLWLQSEGLKYQPDLVVLSLFINDFDEAFVSFNKSIGRPKGYLFWNDDGLHFHPPSISLLYALSHHSYLLGGLDHKLRILSRSASTADPPVQLDNEQKKRLLGQLLLSARDLCRSQGAEFAVAYFPYKGQETRYLSRG